MACKKATRVEYEQARSLGLKTVNVRKHRRSKPKDLNPLIDLNKEC